MKNSKMKAKDDLKKGDPVVVQDGKLAKAEPVQAGDGVQDRPSLEGKQYRLSIKRMMWEKGSWEITLRFQGMLEKLGGHYKMRIYYNQQTTLDLIEKLEREYRELESRPSLLEDERNEQLEDKEKMIVELRERLNANIEKYQDLVFLVWVKEFKNEDLGRKVKFVMGTDPDHIRQLAIISQLEEIFKVELINFDPKSNG